jgi:two-component system, OmpR family, phosphate regulon sensor histidine kinase PhoR
VDISRTLPADVTGAELLEAVTRVVADALVHLDEERRIVRFNAPAERLLGCSALSVLGVEFSQLYHASNTSDPFDAPATDGVRATPLVLRNSQGEAVQVWARSSPIIVRDGTPEFWLVAFSPKQRAGEIEQLKNELVSTVSHELKTPLAAIKAYTATLRSNPTLYEAHRDEFLAVVEQQADRLSRLVEDMLLVTRVDSSQLLRRRVAVALDDVLDEAIRDVQPDPVTHPIERKTRGVQVSGDPERLRDIFRNVLENAVKYSPDGGAITIKAASHENQTAVEITDRGRGISEDHLPYIFDRFYRAQSDTTAPIGGSGLGLYIVHALVRAHGGTIDVRSAPGEGTTFVLRLPLR